MITSLFAPTKKRKLCMVDNDFQSQLKSSSGLAVNVKSTQSRNGIEPQVMVLKESSSSIATQSKAEIVTYQVPGTSYTTTSRGLPRSKQKKD